MQSQWENYCRIFAELSQFRAKRLYFTESVNLCGFLVRSLNVNGNWAKFFPNGEFSGKLAGISGKFPRW